jgi:hypothetical protein
MDQQRKIEEGGWIRGVRRRIPEKSSQKLTSKKREREKGLVITPAGLCLAKNTCSISSESSYLFPGKNKSVSTIVK